MLFFLRLAASLTHGHAFSSPPALSTPFRPRPLGCPTRRSASARRRATSPKLTAQTLDIPSQR